MGLERNLKRSQSQELSYLPDSSFASATSSAAALPRHAFSARVSTHPHHRTASPPASAYFPPLSGDHHQEIKPNTPDASAHFAYSTSLRIHTGEGGLSSPAAGNVFPTLDELRTTVERNGAVGLWQSTVSRLRALFSRKEEGYEPLPATQKEAQRETASARFAHYSAEVSSTFIALGTCINILQDTLEHFGVSATTGLPSASISGLLDTHGYNEFSVSAPEPTYIKFAKTIYESPLILLLCGSAVVSAIMGNVDDAISITVAVLIVLTGESIPSVYEIEY